jgi:hypothetical protein
LLHYGNRSVASRPVPDVAREAAADRLMVVL